MFRILFALICLLMGVVLGGDMWFVIEEGKIRHWFSVVATSWLAVCCLATALYLFCGSAFWLRRMRCPQCSASELKPTVIRFQRASAIGFWFVGFLHYAWVKARPRNLQCGQCQSTVSVFTVGSWLGVAWLIAVILSLVDVWTNHVS